MDDSDEEKSWSFVDEQEARDQIPGATSSKSSGDHEGASARRQQDSADLDATLAEEGNNRPACPALLEAVPGTSSFHQQDQNSPAISSIAPSIPQDPEATNLQHKALEKSDTSAAAEPSKAAPPTSSDEEALQLQDKQSQAISGDESSTSGSLYGPHDLPPLHTATDYADYNYSEEDDMSQSSSNTAVLVENPCSDEEDNAERRWRLGMQRQDDIRRAQAPPCPRAAGTEGFLNVIVVGEAGLGKTTFIQNLQAAFQPELPSPRSPHPKSDSPNLYELFKQSPEQLCTEVTVNTDASRFHYRIQDTPGLVYGQTNVRIPAHISKQNRRYLEREQDPLRTQPMSATPDHRVDACLFFLNQNHVKDAEIAAMIQISELVPVVPLIAKADSFEEPELAAYKLLFQRRMAEEEARLGRPIIWRPAAAVAPAGAEEEEEEGCLQGPFAVIGSGHTDLAVGRSWPVRSYKWGKCEALSSTNSDVVLLKRLLFEEGFAQLKKDTEERYYNFRTAHLTEAAARQTGAAAAQADVEMEGIAQSGVDAYIESGVDAYNANPQSEDEEDAFYDESGAQRRAGENRPAQRRSHRNFWMWGMVITGLLCTALIGNVSQLKADKRALQHKLNVKDQDVLHMGAVKPAAHQEQRKPVTSDKKKTSSGGGSACTMLISAWRDAAPAVKHKRRQSSRPAAQNETAGQSTDLQAESHPEHVVLLNPKVAQSSQGSAAQLKVNQSKQGPSSAVLVPYRPFTFHSPSQQVLQLIERAATTVGSLGSSAGAHSLAVVRHSSRQAAAYAAAASQAVVRFLHHVADQSQAVGCHSSVAVYHGISNSWAAFVQSVGTAQDAMLRGRQAVARGLGAFSHDVAEASRVVLRDAPAVAGQMQQDVVSAADGAKRAVKQLCHAVGHKLTAASQQIDQAAQQAAHTMQKSSMRHWNAQMWIRFAARLGVLGAAL